MIPHRRFRKQTAPDTIIELFLNLSSRPSFSSVVQKQFFIHSTVYSVTHQLKGIMHK